MTSHKQLDPPIADDVEQMLRAALSRSEDRFRDIADDGFSEHVLTRLNERIRVRRKRERIVLNLVGLLSALVAAALAHDAISRIIAQLGSVSDSLGSTTVGASHSIAPVLIFLSLAFFWLLIERATEEYA